MSVISDFFTTFLSFVNNSSIIGFIRSSRNQDGGYGNWKNAPSSMESTFQAIDLLNSFDELSQLSSVEKTETISYILSLQYYRSAPRGESLHRCHGHTHCMSGNSHWQRITSCQKGLPGRTANSLRIKTCKFHSFLCHLIKGWCLNRALPIASQVAIPQVIRHNEDNVGFTFWLS